MIERFRDLSPPFRYLAYATGALLVLSVAVGVGAAAAVVVGWQSGAATTGSAKSDLAESRSTETSTPEAGKSETTGTTQKSPSKSRGVSFVHRATDENSRGITPLSATRA